MTLPQLTVAEALQLLLKVSCIYIRDVLHVSQILMFETKRQNNGVGFPRPQHYAEGIRLHSAAGRMAPRWRMSTLGSSCAEGSKEQK